MGWVQIHISHGPGHQSSTDYYRYFNAFKGMSIKDQVEEFAEEMVNCNYMDWPCMEWKSIRKLPASIHKDRMEDLRHTVKSAKASLELLKKTPILMVDPIIRKETIRKRKHERLMKKIYAENVIKAKKKAMK